MCVLRVILSATAAVPYGTTVWPEGSVPKCPRGSTFVGNGLSAGTFLTVDPTGSVTVGCMTDAGRAADVAKGANLGATICYPLA